jgi:hypothetical protein
MALKPASPTHLQVDIAEALSATQVESLISDLAAHRGNMLPPVSKGRPDGPNQRISVQDAPSLSAVRLRDGRIRLYLSNQGLGWLAFNIPLADGIALRDFLIANIPEQSAGPTLFGIEADNGPAH